MIYLTLFELCGLLADYLQIIWIMLGLFDSRGGVYSPLEKFSLLGLFV